MSNADVESFVNRYFDDIKKTNKGWRVHCPLPSHNDSDPSCTIFFSGNFYCLGCKGKGSFYDLKKLFGVEESKGTNTIYIERVKFVNEKIEKPKKFKKQLNLQDIDREWRGFSPEFLNSMGCKHWYSIEYFESQTVDAWYKTTVPRIYMPFIIRGIRYGWTGRSLKSKVTIEGETFKPDRYYIQPNDLDTSSIMYGYDDVLPNNEIFIVEGPVDRLRLCSYGFQAVSIISSTGWTDKKLSLLLAKRPKKVYICGDGDDAGEKMNKTIYSSIRNYLDAEIIELEDGADPDSVDKSFWKPYKKEVNLIRKGIYNGEDN